MKSDKQEMYKHKSGSQKRQDAAKRKLEEASNDASQAKLKFGSGMFVNSCSCSKPKTVWVMVLLAAVRAGPRPRSAVVATGNSEVMCVSHCA